MNDEPRFIQPNLNWLGATELPKKPLKIVWVEDCPALQEMVKSLVHDAFKDAEILSFADGDAAWAQLERESPDLLMSDLIHPGMDGFEMLSRLSRKDVAYPIIIVSGNLPGRERWARHCAGQWRKVHYLPKPFIYEHFITLLEQCLHRHRSDECLVRWIGSMDRPLKIVQLDDDEPILNLVAALLQRCFKNLQLYQFQNSPTAWKILTQAEPDLLITDDIMHGDSQWNGRNIVPCLVERKVPYPILLISGLGLAQEWVRQVQAEHRKFSYLQAPISRDDFYRELGRYFAPLNLPSSK